MVEDGTKQDNVKFFQNKKERLVLCLKEMEQGLRAGVAIQEEAVEDVRPEKEVKGLAGELEVKPPGIDATVVARVAGIKVNKF